jgi:hypothetical protein
MSVNFALTYANDLCLDGAGAQLQRLLGTYAIARLLGVPYVHSPLTHVGYQGLASLEKNAGSDYLVERYNRVFRLPSDLDLPADPVVHMLNDADVESIDRIKAEATRGGFHLARVVYPYPITDQHPEAYRCLKAISPFRYRESEVFRLAVHVRRGELFAIDSHRMLPNSYYVSTALRFQEILRKLEIPCVCELYTEVATKAFDVTPDHHGINRRISANVAIHPAMSRLEDFDAIPNLVRFVNTDPIDTLRRMTTADALILSRSSFSYVAAVLSQNCIVLYYPFWHSPMEDWLITGADGFREDAVVERLTAWKAARRIRA